MAPSCVAKTTLRFRIEGLTRFSFLHHFVAGGGGAEMRGGMDANPSASLSRDNGFFGLDTICRIIVLEDVQIQNPLLLGNL
jgi:hypothetical protein